MVIRNSVPSVPGEGVKERNIQVSHYVMSNPNVFIMYTCFTCLIVKQEVIIT
jgi:hypothetical protein